MSATVGTPAAPAADPHPRGFVVAGATRLRSLDVFRGLTVAGMLLVNNPGTWSAIHPPLQHAPWHGWTPTDLIFPFFLFIVGVTTHLSLSSRRARGVGDAELIRQIVRRGLIIVLCGLLLASFPWWPLSRITEVRIPGVLQRIGFAYMAAALLTLNSTPRSRAVTVAVLLLGYWAAMTLIPVPGFGLGPHNLDDPSASIAAWLDRTLFGSHLWRSSGTWDPEGLLSTVPAIATVILGVSAGRTLSTARPVSEKLVVLFGVGSLLMVAGLVWNWVLPINKNLWTGSYVLFTGGMASVALATCTWLIDVLGMTRWSEPFVWFGVNPMIAFLGSGAMARLMGSVISVPMEGGGVQPLQRVIYDSLFAGWLEPRNASLLYAVTFVILWGLILGLLHRRRIHFRI
ncbi:MAG: acyltransferase family protein [Gemmatimonadota bacterium]